jgi:uncharacterized small protein (DUF1192 family)
MNDETPRERFERIASTRLVRWRRETRLLGNLSHGRYSYSEREVVELIATMHAEVDILKAQLMAGYGTQVRRAVRLLPDNIFVQQEAQRLEAERG